MAHSRILEVTLLSAEDLLEVYKTMKTYAIVWVQPDRKLATGIDQTGGTHPAWNEKFSFRVDDKFLSSEDDAKIFVEIYEAAWVKDALVGCVNANINDIFHLCSVTDSKINNNSTARTVTLQVRRPSGRPQGILNMEVSLVDSTMRSLPLLEEPIPKPAENDHHEDDESQNDKLNVNVNAKMTRSQSDRTELKMEDNSMERPVKGSTINDGFDASELDDKCNGSMVNGGSVCSTDVGPSASVVAAAIAHGLYKPPVGNENPTGGNRIPEIDQREKRKGRDKSFGIEISITCGGNEAQGGINGNGNNYKVYHLSDADDDYSQSIV
ncbi:hypothetical protein GOBAR_AA34655 [Gossypium barbadense]|uniref:C2 domain-containing protein n=1 Tax=Gossypium barbadense TaxID=3634 RepID=A0A2P5W4K2_GOSBA|nr:hypothetical protein GOBAR_AA34655 [Gossypium barbadense]